MRSEGTVVGLCVCVCVCVCLSVTLHLTTRMFVRLTNDTTYLTGNEGRNFRTVFSENAPLQSYSTTTIVRLMPVVAILSLRKMHMRIIFDHLVLFLVLSVRPSVCLSVCYHVFYNYAQQGGQKAIPMGSVPHWLDFRNGNFRKSTTFKSYGGKTKQTSQYANEHGLPRPDSAHFEHGGGSTSNTKGKYVVLVFQKHYLPM